MPVQKAIVAGSLAVLLAALAASAAWFRARLPPNCSDPRTVALVRQSLTTRYQLPPGTTLDNIRTIAGGWLALRFVCTADLSGFEPHDLPPGMPLPGQVRYTSRLAPDRSRHDVTVELRPLLIWKNAQ
ncbi:MAG TPA: hypothetical protein VND19_05805 [Acetobacteraceae bacterium]|nr:hypothetical protein [Acetobacteraceae bacterium]